MEEMIDILKGDEDYNFIGFLEVAYEKDGPSLLKKLGVDKLARATEPESLIALKQEFKGTYEGCDWVGNLWEDIALTFSKHYWDGIPGKYFREWGNSANYMVE